MTQQFVNPYVEYLSMFMQSPKVAQSITDLIDCLTINDILSKIPEFPQCRIEEAPLTFAHIFSNLKQTYRRIQSFWNQNLDRQLECRQIDLVDIAHNLNQKQFTKIIDIAIQSCILSSQRDFFIKKMVETSLSTQQYFMTVVQQTLQARNTFSPRKRKQQRLYDRLVELDHQNQNLQNVISEICQQKYQMETTYRSLFEKISEKDTQILKLSKQTSALFQTPQRRRIYGSIDSVQKNNQYIDRLKAKIIHISKQHQKQLLILNEKLECYTMKINKIEEYQQQMDLYRVKIMSNQQALMQFQDISKKYAQIKIAVIEKDQIIAEQYRKLGKKTIIIQNLEQQLLEKNIQIQKKNVRIEECSRTSTNNSFLDDSMLRITPIPLQKSISECACDSLTHKIANFHEINNILREQLSKAQLKLSEKQSQIKKMKKQCSDLQLKNRKMADFIEDNLSQDVEQSNICLDGLRLYTRDKTIRSRLRQTLESASNANRQANSRRSRGKQNYQAFDSQASQLQYSSIYSTAKSKSKSKSKAKNYPSQPLQQICTFSHNQ